jgi:hypothetical protein
MFAIRMNERDPLGRFVIAGLERFPGVASLFTEKNFVNWLGLAGPPQKFPGGFPSTNAVWSGGREVFEFAGALGEIPTPDPRNRNPILVKRKAKVPQR